MGVVSVSFVRSRMSAYGTRRTKSVGRLTSASPEQRVVVIAINPNLIGEGRRHAATAGFRARLDLR